MVTEGLHSLGPEVALASVTFNSGLQIEVAMSSGKFFGIHSVLSFSY